MSSSETIRVTLDVELRDGKVAELRELAKEADIRNLGGYQQEYTPDQAFAVVLNRGDVMPLQIVEDGFVDGWVAQPSEKWSDETLWSEVP